jgi:hypothetical protein
MQQEYQVHSSEPQIAFEIEIDDRLSAEMFNSSEEIAPSLLIVGTNASPEELERLVKSLPSRFVGNLLHAIGSVMENR